MTPIPREDLRGRTAKQVLTELEADSKELREVCTLYVLQQLLGFGKPSSYKLLKNLGLNSEVVDQAVELIETEIRRILRAKHINPETGNYR